MVLRPEYESLRALLVETVTLLCRNGLKFKKKFNIEGLLGLTIDDGEVVLIKLDEVVRHDQVPVTSSTLIPVRPVAMPTMLEARNQLPVPPAPCRPPPLLQAIKTERVTPSAPVPAALPPAPPAVSVQQPAAPSSSSRRKRTNPQPHRRPPAGEVHQHDSHVTTSEPTDQSNHSTNSPTIEPRDRISPPPLKRMRMPDINQNTPGWPGATDKLQCDVISAEEPPLDQDDVELTRKAYYDGVSRGSASPDVTKNTTYDEEDSIGQEVFGGEWQVEVKSEAGSDVTTTPTGQMDQSMASVGSKYEVQTLSMPNGVVKKVFLCLEENCGLTFSSYANWAQHTATIHQGVVYVCAHCTASFTRLGTLRKHCEKYHQNRLNWTKGVRTPKSSQAKNSKNKTPNRGGKIIKCDVAKGESSWDAGYVMPALQPISIEPMMDLARAAAQRAVLAQVAGARLSEDDVTEEERPLNMSMTSSDAGSPGQPVSDLFNRNSTPRDDKHARTMSALVNRLTKVKQEKDEVTNNNNNNTESHMSVQLMQA